MTTPLVVRVASDPRDLEQVRRLNYRTFVEEIPQHAPNDARALRDRFEEQSTFVIATRGERLVGMLAARSERPFSLDAKVEDLDALLPAGRSPCEVRLLAVEPDERGGTVLHGLVTRLAELFLDRGHDLAVISGTTRQLALYRHLGFEPFGPLVGTPVASYQPMYLTLERFVERSRAFARRPGAARAERAVASFLPGPTTIAAAVRDAFAAAPVSHRAPAFVESLGRLRAELCALTGAAHAQLGVGSATLANDLVGGQLARAGAPGLVLANGEFGERLADHAARWRLPHAVHRVPWGAAFDVGDVARALDACRGAGWLWAAHCETSTGVLNDVAALRALCAARGVRLVLDSVSAVGSVPVDLSGVHLASATSGKGLGSFAGLAIVFHDAPVTPAPGVLPRYLDLGLYAQGDGVPFTHSSNLVHALRAALERRDWPAHLAAVARDGAALRRRLRAVGLTIVAPEAHAAPAVTTIALPPSVCSADVGEALARAGFRVAWESDYLRRRNWMQICLMGDYPRASIGASVLHLASLTRAASAASAA